MLSHISLASVTWCCTPVRQKVKKLMAWLFSEGGETLKGFHNSHHAFSAKRKRKITKLPLIKNMSTSLGSNTCWLSMKGVISRTLSGLEILDLPIKSFVWSATIVFGNLFQYGCILGQPKFFLGFPPQTPRWSLGQILPGHQFSANSEVVWPRHGGSECPQVGLILPLPGDLWSLCDVVKRLRN